MGRVSTKFEGWGLMLKEEGTELKHNSKEKKTNYVISNIFKPWVKSFTRKKKMLKTEKKGPEEEGFEMFASNS